MLRRTAFELLQAGEIDRHEYADLKVMQATEHLRDLPHVALIRARLRIHMQLDPICRQLLGEAARAACYGGN
jgi:hypothetical protein